ncbi:unnamed protein product [Microthlaspi erraticum]|uniref:Uncharacterized protein n=1 Tax=Microthlaspi erraticum TaxID=1685480 RepID=A0A6D2HLF5_9BRAS|nr:unnamed protein product [Microthlaspi erraticum]
MRSGLLLSLSVGRRVSLTRPSGAKIEQIPTGCGFSEFCYKSLDFACFGKLGKFLRSCALSMEVLVQLLRYRWSRSVS